MESSYSKKVIRSRSALPCLPGKSYKRRGLAEDCIPVLLASLSDYTIKQYNASLQKWWTFCSEDNLDVFNSDSKLV
ncbi:unnamed protein product, partial [Callosobruchus maculatus]